MTERIFKIIDFLERECQAKDAQIASLLGQLKIAQQATAVPEEKLDRKKSPAKAE